MRISTGPSMRAGGGRRTHECKPAIGFLSCTGKSQRFVVAYSLNHNGRDTSVVKSSIESRDSIRLGLPSKGRMAEDALDLLNVCQLKCMKPNPRQYFGQIDQFPEMEVWFQRASDVVRKLRSRDIDIGIVGMDMFAEFAAEDPDLVIVHDALDFGTCKLELGVPTRGKFAEVDTIEDLKSMEWTANSPLRVVTGYTNIASTFFEREGFEHVALLSADGALEAAPAMGAADIILDLVSTGVTLRENNLKTVKGGRIMHSEGVLVANRTSLLQRPGLLRVVHELLERFEAHLVACEYYGVTCNIRAEDPAVFAARMRAAGLTGMEGPTISKVYGESDITYASCICVHKKKLYDSIKKLRDMGGSGVLVSPMTYIFDEVPERWPKLLAELGIQSDPILGESPYPNYQSDMMHQV